MENKHRLWIFWTQHILFNPDLLRHRRATRLRPCGFALIGETSYRHPTNSNELNDLRLWISLVEHAAMIGMYPHQSSDPNKRARVCEIEEGKEPSSPLSWATTANPDRETHIGADACVI